MEDPDVHAYANGKCLTHGKDLADCFYQCRIALAEAKARAEAREKALADRIEVLETECRESLTERDALAATVKELLGCLASADWDSHEMDDARRLLESLSSPKPSTGPSAEGK